MAGGAGGGARPPAGEAFKHEGLALACFFTLGCGFLTGWNSFLQCTDYFNIAFPGRSIDRVFTVIYLPLTYALVTLLSRWPRLLGGGRARVLAGYSLFTLCTAAVPVIDAALIGPGGGPGSPAALALVLCAIALVGVGDGLSQGTVFGEAALLPDKYTQAVVMGASASGVIIGLLRIATKGALPQTTAGLRASSWLYFGASAAITACCLVVYGAVMPRLDVVAHYRARLAEEQQAAGTAAHSKRHSEAGSVPSRGSHSNASFASARLRALRSSGGDDPEAQPLSPPEGRSPGGSPRALLLAPQPRSPGAAAGGAGGPRSPRDGGQPPAGRAAPCSPRAAEAWACAGPGPAPLSPGRGLAGRASSGGGSGGAFAAFAAGARSPPKGPGSADAWTLDGLAAAAASLPPSSKQHQRQRQQHHPPGAGAEAELAGELSWSDVLRLNWRLCLAVFLVYLATLSIFPGFLAEDIHSDRLQSWYPVLLIFSFNAADFASRCVPCRADGGCLPGQRALLAAAALRLAAVALLFPLLAAALRGGGGRGGEAAFFTLTALLGASNGLLTALIFCAAPRGLPPAAAEKAGMVNVSFELAGLNAGAVAGWLWTVGK